MSRKPHEPTDATRQLVSLHLRYKVACTQRSIKMNDDIRQFIERRCEELEG